MGRIRSPYDRRCGERGNRGARSKGRVVPAVPAAKYHQPEVTDADGLQSDNERPLPGIASDSQRRLGGDIGAPLRRLSDHDREKANRLTFRIIAPAHWRMALVYWGHCRICSISRETPRYRSSSARTGLVPGDAVPWCIVGVLQDAKRKPRRACRLSVLWSSVRERRHVPAPPGRPDSFNVPSIRRQ